MREEVQKSVVKQKTGKGRKVLVSFGILLITAGVFLGSFACSFQMMIESAKSSQEDENSLAIENKKLQSDVQLLQDQITILETELERYKPSPTSTTGSGSRASSTASSSATTGSKATSTSGRTQSSR